MIGSTTLMLLQLCFCSFAFVVIIVIITRYTHIINGYIGTESFLLKLAEVVKVMKERNPGLV